MENINYLIAKSRNKWGGLVLSAIFVVLTACSPLPGQPLTDDVTNITPSPTPDRLAEPILPEDPTQYEQGRHLYWLNCMPCHGDMGQGLTDEFRNLWEEDHQNCWASGCHGGRSEDQGMLIPHHIPAIISTNGNVLHYSTAEDLFDYLRTTHPPQHPGYLPEEDYWAITAFILVENKFLPLEQEVGPRARSFRIGTIQWLAGIAIVLLIVSTAIVWSQRRQKDLTRRIS